MRRKNGKTGVTEGCIMKDETERLDQKEPGKMGSKQGREKQENLNEGGGGM